jgi:hypothetical protein
MYISTALRSTPASSTRLVLASPDDSTIGKVFPIDPVSSYRQSETLGHRPLRKRRINSPKPSFSEYPSRYHQVDEYV